MLPDPAAPDIRIFPQPASDNVIIEHLATADGLLIELCDIAGRTAFPFGRLSNEGRIVVDISAIATGYYLLRGSGRNREVITQLPLIIAR